MQQKRPRFALGTFLPLKPVAVRKLPNNLLAYGINQGSYKKPIKDYLTKHRQSELQFIMGC